MSLFNLRFSPINGSALGNYTTAYNGIFNDSTMPSAYILHPVTLLKPFKITFPLVHGNIYGNHKSILRRTQRPGG